MRAESAQDSLAMLAELMEEEEKTVEDEISDLSKVCVPADAKAPSAYPTQSCDAPSFHPTSSTTSASSSTSSSNSTSASITHTHTPFFCGPCRSRIFR